MFVPLMKWLVVMVDILELRNPKLLCMATTGDRANVVDGL